MTEAEGCWGRGLVNYLICHGVLNDKQRLLFLFPFFLHIQTHFFLNTFHFFHLHTLSKHFCFSSASSCSVCRKAVHTEQLEIWHSDGIGASCHIMTESFQHRDNVHNELKRFCQRRRSRIMRMESSNLCRNNTYEPGVDCKRKPIFCKARAEACNSLLMTIKGELWKRLSRFGFGIIPCEIKHAGVLSVSQFFPWE